MKLAKVFLLSLCTLYIFYHYFLLFFSKIHNILYVHFSIFRYFVFLSYIYIFSFSLLSNRGRKWRLSPLCHHLPNVVPNTRKQSLYLLLHIKIKTTGFTFVKILWFSPFLIPFYQHTFTERKLFHSIFPTSLIYLHTFINNIDRCSHYTKCC